MIDQFSDDGSGWAQFSDDMTMRFRLARSLTTARIAIVDGRVIGLLRIVFLMLNPSTADAFKPDPTVRECIKFARAWGGDVLEVVNLFALRSPYPEDLRKYTYGRRGDDPTNDDAIRSACLGAHRVIAAWGAGGDLDHRATTVRNLIVNHVPLFHLGLTKDGYPKHPLARGKHRISSQQQPIPWIMA